MNRFFENTWYLSFEEFLVLAAACGIKNLEGIFPDTGAAVKEEQEVLYIFSRLYRKGLVGEDRQVGSELKDVFRILKKASYLLVLQGVYNPGKKVSCYLGDRMLILEASVRDEAFVRMGTGALKEFPGWLQEESYWPSVYSEPGEPLFMPETVDQNPSDFTLHVESREGVVKADLMTGIQLYGIGRPSANETWIWFRRRMYDYLLETDVAGSRIRPLQAGMLEKKLRAVLQDPSVS